MSDDTEYTLSNAHLTQKYVWFLAAYLYTVCPRIEFTRGKKIFLKTSK
jgi:hypothetical protein